MMLVDQLAESIDALRSGAIIASRETLPTTRQLEALHREIDREIQHARRWRAFWVLPVREA